MRYSTVTLLGLAAVGSATWDGQFSYPPGIDPMGLSNGNVEFNIKTFGPLTGPPAGCISVWHPPHPDVYIDDCNSDKEHGWHWVHPGKPKWKHPGKDKDHEKPKKPGYDKPKHPDQPDQPDKPDQPDQPYQPEQPEPTTTPQWKWTTSTITQTAISTIYSCPPSVTNCPGKGGGTQYETVTVPAIVTICPVPVEPIPGPTSPPAAPPPAPTAPPAEPVPSAPSPPKTLSSVVIPPPVSSGPAEVPPVPSSPPEAPPATTTRPSVGTITRPNPTATSGRAAVTAGAAQNVQRAGGVLVAAVAAVAAFI
ncbi:hypothetical protein CSHISOI_08830 [Colletotrichum shisoi]|uniref:Uncharacterized protein n=1 Tax=Colletotrichum shisoi TaxID=2078593 RepID=A0A5Q4BI31_9PEZI|nr:hypothetical protein CSHISOI_08830 [Colletotrichum shisoi]